MILGFQITNDFDAILRGIFAQKTELWVGTFSIIVDIKRNSLIYSSSDISILITPIQLLQISLISYLNFANRFITRSLEGRIFFWPDLP
jgi:hypothetical protein